MSEGERSRAPRRSQIRSEGADAESRKSRRERREERTEHLICSRPVLGGSDHLRPGADRAGPEKLPRVVSELAAGSGARAPWPASSASSSKRRCRLEAARQGAGPDHPGPGGATGERGRERDSGRAPDTSRTPTPPTPPARPKRRMSEEPENLAEGTLISHLLELRDRLLRAPGGRRIGFGRASIIPTTCLRRRAPAARQAAAGKQPIATGVMSPSRHLQAVVLRRMLHRDALRHLPTVVVRRSGLYRNERRFAVPLLVSSIGLFYVGIAFAYYFVFPVMFQFFAGTTPKGVAMMTDINNYLDFVLTMFFLLRTRLRSAVAVVLLVRWVSCGSRNSGSTAATCCRHFILAALLTPPDAISQCSLAIPMYLSMKGILMARLLARPKGAQAAAKAGDT